MATDHRVVSTTFVLTGHYAGKDVRLGSERQYHFSGGRMAVTLSEREVKSLARYLERCYEAYPEGHPALPKEEVDGERDSQEGAGGWTPEEVPGGGHQPGWEGSPEEASEDRGRHAGGEPGDAGLHPEGNGLEDTGLREEVTEDEQGRLRTVIAALDPAVDDHWTEDGKPALDAIDQALGRTDTARADVDATAPGWTRRAALEEAALLREITEASQSAEGSHP